MIKTVNVKASGYSKAFEFAEQELCGPHNVLNLKIERNALEEEFTCSSTWQEGEEDPLAFAAQLGNAHYEQENRIIEYVNKHLSMFEAKLRELVPNATKVWVYPLKYGDFLCLHGFTETPGKYGPITGSYKYSLEFDNCWKEW